MSLAADALCEPRPPAKESARDLTAEVLAGLARRPKRLSSRWFYDERGSQLFERICELPEYYLTRTETAILERHAPEIAAHLGPEALLVEYGSGASTKTRLLLDRLERVIAYVPVDISREHLLAASAALAARYARLEVLPLCADFTQPLTLPEPRRRARRRVLFFPGSTLGNFDRAAAIELLTRMRAAAGTRGSLVLGADLVKDRGRLLRAYDDAQGLTAEFDRNALLHVNRRLGADFNVLAFRHEAVWNEAQSRIEMHLVAVRDQLVRLGGRRITFRAGEPLITEHCYKYTIPGCAALAAEAGWSLERSFTDEQRDFAVLCFQAAVSSRRAGR